MRLHKILPVGFFKRATLYKNRKSKDEIRQMIRDFVRDTDPEFIRWSLNAIVTWQHKERLPQLVQIHGSGDFLLPCRYTKADYVIPKGGHLMVLNRPEEISKIIKEVVER